MKTHKPFVPATCSNGPPRGKTYTRRLFRAVTSSSGLPWGSFTTTVAEFADMPASPSRKRLPRTTAKFRD